MIVSLVSTAVRLAQSDKRRDEGRRKNNSFLLPSSRAPRKLHRSPRLAHKAPVMQATEREAAGSNPDRTNTQGLKWHLQTVRPSSLLG